MDEPTREAFERLLRIAHSDTGQSRRVADFILAWWNADSLGGFDLADLFAVDKAIARDMTSVFAWLASRAEAGYPVDYRAQIEEIIQLWRPEVLERVSRTA
jgi:hypothetical protein